MKPIIYSAAVLAKASDGNPIISTAVTMLFYLFFAILEANIEKLAFGDRFEHWLDPVFILCFISYAGYSVYACAEHNTRIAAKTSDVLKRP